MTSAPVRDAERSRAAILDAAEELFAQRGFQAASLADIAGRAGLSRGAPSYFFGSKEELYAAVLERLHDERNAILGPLFAPLGEWARADGDPPQALAALLGRAVGGYLDFLRSRPAFVQICEREALAGGDRLARLTARSTVMEDAFGALRQHAAARGLARFEVPEVVLALVALAYTPVAHRDTILRRHGLTLDERFVERHTEHVVGVLMYLLGARA